MRLFVFLILVALPALGGPITVTILDQTVEVSATAYDNFNYCSHTGTFTATCYVSDTISPLGTYPVIAAAYGSATISGSTLQVNSSASPSGNTVGYATASITDNVLITGGTGTGYLNFAFAFQGEGPYASAGPSLTANGQYGTLQKGYAVDTVSGVFAFTFDQPFTYKVSLFEGTGSADTLDNGQLSFVAARIFTAQPSQCYTPSPNAPFYYGLCIDSGFVSANVLGSAIPEPNTAWLLAGMTIFPAIKVLRRFLR